MHHHKRLWLGGLVCAVALSLTAMAWAAGPESTHAAAESTKSAAEAHGEGGGGLISLDRSLIVQVVNFVILLLILWRLLYRPLVAKMEERSEAIKRSLDEAQAARAEAARQQEENASRLREAFAEAAQIRQQALKEAADEQRKLVDAARAESQRLVDSAKAQMDADIRRAREELRSEVADLATAVAEKLVRKSLRDDDHRRIVADAVADLGR